MGTQYHLLNCDFADYRSWAEEEVAKTKGLLYQPRPHNVGNAQTFAIDADDEDDNGDDGSDSTESENRDELTADAFRSADAGGGVVDVLPPPFVPCIPPTVAALLLSSAAD